MINYLTQDLQVVDADDLINRHEMTLFKFRCQFCAKPFKEGDKLRFVYGGNHQLGNFFVCGICDSPLNLSRAIRFNMQQGWMFVEDTMQAQTWVEWVEKMKKEGY